MAELSEPQKERIVLLLARFRSPAEVAADFKEHFQLELEIQQIVKYDPSRPSFDAGEKWCTIFAVAREAYLKDVAAVPVANQAYRLNLLQEGIDAAKKAKNWKLVAELAEQASKEAGGVFTNARDLNINDGRKPKDMPQDDRVALLGSILAEALDKRNADRAPVITKH